VLGTEPWALGMLSLCSTTESHPLGDPTFTGENLKLLGGDSRIILRLETQSLILKVSYVSSMVLSAFHELSYLIITI
jgi:hypothetical protein